MDNLYKNRAHHIYLPKDDTNPYSVGEVYFFKSKFWKVQVMIGNWWSDITNTKTGFSIFNMYSRKRIEKLLSKLNNLGIEYKTDISKAGYQFRVHISGKKKNLEHIDRLYAEFYNRTLKESQGWFRYKNEIMDANVRYDKDIYFSKHPDDEFEQI